MRNGWSVPLKSASVLIARVSSNRHYEILFIQRPSKGAFANVYAFPGGVYEKRDFTLTSQLLKRVPTKEEQMKVTGIRETFEEVGIAIHDGRSNNWGDPAGFMAKVAGIDYLMPVIRLITVPFLKHRYDTYFYFCALDPKHTMNLFDLQNNSSGDYSQLVTNKKEVVKYEWLSPEEALRKKFKKEIELAPPQMIILNSLSSLNTVESVRSFYQDALCHSTYQISLKVNKNEANKHIYPYVALNLYDEEYPINELIENEKDCELVNELKSQGHNATKGMRNRFYFQDSHEFFSKDFDVEVSLPFKTPFSNLVNTHRLLEAINK